jgi:aquaporin Z
VNAWQSLRHHWPEYLIEGWALGMFMISAGVFTLLLEYPGSLLHQAIADPGLRRALIGVAMGFTAIGLVYSRWGQQSGAHMNPAVTLTFWRLGKIQPADAVFYMLAQFAGGILGVVLVDWVFGAAFEQSPVNYVATLPGKGGEALAFVAEVVISLGMMLTVLVCSNNERLARYTGLCAGALVALYITFEAPLSGMSMNPARSFASALPGKLWESQWLYFTAPVLGMLLGAQLYLSRKTRQQVHCAKLLHPDTIRCIHCNYEPAQADKLPGMASPTGGN